jgi:hypothetical protein
VLKLSAAPVKNCMLRPKVSLLADKKSVSVKKKAQKTAVSACRYWTEIMAPRKAAPGYIRISNILYYSL